MGVWQLRDINLFRGLALPLVLEAFGVMVVVVRGRPCNSWCAHLGL